MSSLTPTQRKRARQLRRGDTAAEQRLWAHLRGRRLHSLKFVRQLPLGPYIADFACREHRLIVEVDGATHGTEKEIRHDDERTAFLTQSGWRILRVWNDDVFRSLDDVLETIARACAASGT